MGKVSQLWCFLVTGHDFLVVRERGRLFSQCVHCGYATCGWVLGVERAEGLEEWRMEDFQEAYQQLVEMELEVHGGG